jgi:hypothetical protein
MKMDALLELSEEEANEVMDAEMEATSRVYGICVGDVIDRATFDAIQLYDKYNREEEEGRTTVFHQGYQAGMRRAGGVDTAKLIEERDTARTSAQVANALRTASARHNFLWGARACREMMARFVEQGGNTATAASIRANWHPAWGTDPGTVDDVAELPEIDAKPLDVGTVQ